MRILYSKFRAITAVAVVVIVALCVFGITNTVKAETCTWTASTSLLMSEGTNWSDGATNCTIDPLDTLVFNSAVTSSDATWDIIGAASVTTDAAYTGTITLAGSATTTALTLNGGTFVNNSTDRLKINGDLTVASGATFSGNGGLEISGSILNSGTFGLIASSTIMTGTGKTLGGTGDTRLNVLTINSSNTITAGGELITTSTITVGSGATLALGNFGLQTSGTVANSGDITQNASSTVLTGTATLGSATGRTQVNALTISNSNTVTLGGELVATSTITIGSGATLALSNYGLATSGAITNAGDITQMSSSTVLTGTATVGSTGRTQFNVLTINSSNTITAGGELITTSTITVGSGATLALSTHGLETSGSINNSGTITQSAASSTLMTGTANLGGSGGLTTLYNLTIAGTTVTLAGSVTTTNTLTINASKTLNLGASSYILVLSKSSGIPLVNNGTFTAGTSTTTYSGTGAITVASTTYSSLTLGAGTYTFDGNTTSTVAFVNGGATTINTGVTLVASGTIDNNGTITETGAIKHAITSSKLTNSAGTEVATFSTSGGTLYVNVVDTDGNLSNVLANTMTGSVVTANDGTIDRELITLTETGVDTSIFRGSIAFTASAMKTNYNSKLEVNGNGTLSLAFTDSKDSSDTGTDTATYTGSSVGSGGTGGGGGAYLGDVTPPSNTSIKISNNATTTAVTGVVLTLGATDASSMMISNDVAFTGASWEEYKTSKSWTLTSAGGTKTVYAKFRDASNNSSSAISDTIVLEVAGSTTPTATTTPATTPTTDQTTTPSTPATGATTPATGTGTGIQTGTSSGTVSTVKFTKELKYLTTNAGVKTLQTELKKMGYFTYPSLTTFYGAATKAAMVKYQKANGLKQTGNLDKATMAVLNGATPVVVEETPAVPTTYTFTKYLAYGYTGTEVKQLQIRLQELGYLSNTITPNGTFGPATRAAVIKLQKEYKISPTAGFVGPGTRKVLNGK